MMHTPTNESTPMDAPTTMRATNKMPRPSGKQRQRTIRPRQQTQGIFTGVPDKEIVREALSFEKLMTHYRLEVFAHDKVRCIFHGEDRRPSATIKGNFFHCFTCGKSLDVFAFIQAMEHCTFPEALRVGAEIAGITMPERTVTSRKQIAKVVAERKHDISERQRVTMSSEQKYQLLLFVARTIRQSSPQWLSKLDDLLDDWLHEVPSYVDLRSLLHLVQGKHFEAMGPIIERLHAEHRWVNHA